MLLGSRFTLQFIFHVQSFDEFGVNLEERQAKKAREYKLHTAYKLCIPQSKIFDVIK